MLMDLKQEKEISEDDFFKAQEEVQKFTDDFIRSWTRSLRQQENEIRSSSRQAEFPLPFPGVPFRRLR
jgi:ribosome recycling factor